MLLITVVRCAEVVARVRIRVEVVVVVGSCIVVAVVVVVVVVVVDWMFVIRAVATASPARAGRVVLLVADHRGRIVIAKCVDAATAAAAGHGADAEQLELGLLQLGLQVERHRTDLLEPIALAVGHRRQL